MANFNFFKLSGQNVEITYRLDGDPNVVSLTFKNGAVTETAKPDQIQSVLTPLGDLVTIVTGFGIEGQSSRFSFFLPTRPPLARFTSLGIFRDEEGGGLGLPLFVTWRTLNLDGTAETIQQTKG